MYTLTIGKRITLAAETITEAADFYCTLRDESGEGSSTFPTGKIKQGGKLIADISYNGRVWMKAVALIAA